MKMLKQFRSCWAEIDLNAIEYNIATIKSLLGKKTKLTAVIKADAYGHGSVQIAHSAVNGGADILAVSALDEALELRQAQILAPIFILGYSEPSYAPYIVAYDISQTVYNFDMAKALSDAAVKQNKLAHIHIKIDTGMGRIGFLPNQNSYDEIIKILSLPNLHFEGLFTHFSCADEKETFYTKQQFETFIQFAKKLQTLGYCPEYLHTANSAATLRFPEYHLDLVRAGIILYGIFPSKNSIREDLMLKPAMSVKTTISNIKSLPKGNAISYGGNYVTSKDTKIATISIGYADGYPRKLSNQANVIIRNQLAPVIGNICMDQCMVDVSNIDEIEIGDEVVVFGKQGNEYISVEEIAHYLDTISYEVLCDIGRRLPRIYVRDGEIESVVNYLLK